MPDTSDRLPVSPCPRSPRSLRSATKALGLTGALVVLIPLGLLLGKNGLVPVSVNRAAPIPTPHLVTCDSGRTVRSHQLSRGQCVKVVGAGFEPDELIEVSDSRDPSWQTYLRADGAGRFALRRVVPATAAAGPEVLSFVGLARPGSDAVPRVAYCRLSIVTG